jgi:hypothetical protein
MTLRLLASAAVLATLATASALAQQPQTVRVRGPIEAVDGSMLTVKAGGAGDVKVKLTDNAAVYGVVKATLADVKPNAFIGVGATPQADGSQRAIQIMIFAEVDGEKKIIVGPDAVIRAYVVGSKDELKPGANINIVAATKKPDGTFEAARVNVGRDGVVP